MAAAEEEEEEESSPLLMILAILFLIISLFAFVEQYRAQTVTPSSTPAWEKLMP